MKSFISTKLMPLILYRCFSVLMIVYISACSELTDPVEPIQVEPTQLLDEPALEELSKAFETVNGPIKENGTSERGIGRRFTTYEVLLRVNQLTGEFSTLLAAIQAAELVEIVNGEVPITLFTPPDYAFAQIGLDENSVGDLDKEVLQNILLYHGTDRKKSIRKLQFLQQIKMLNGDFALVSKERRKIMINEAKLLTPYLVNIVTRNGVIHVITAVLDPSDSPTSLPPLVRGLAYSPTTKTTNESFDALVSILEGNPNINVIAGIDHAANASTIGKELRPTKLVIFGNPNLGTPLMQLNQTIGIDLPQKVIFYENEKQEVFAGYNTTEYIASRHRIPKGAATLPAISNALQNLVSNATGDSVTPPDISKVRPRAGLVIRESHFDAEETFTRLVAAVDAVEPLRIVAQIDHAANASTVNLSLRPTKLLIFGNPNLGTPLMQSKQTTGIDLPQKMLVWQAQSGQVFLAYNDPFYVARRHKISKDASELSTIAGALANLANAATQP